MYSKILTDTTTVPPLACPFEKNEFSNFSLFENKQIPLPKDLPQRFSTKRLTLCIL